MAIPAIAPPDSPLFEFELAGADEALGVAVMMVICVDMAASVGNTTPEQRVLALEL